MDQRLHVDVLSDEDFEDLIAECYIDDECVMIVNQEHGPDHLEVEVLLRPDGQPRRIEYDVMNELLRRAKARLWELRRVPRAGDQAL
jgi:hypothetical protein